MSNQENSKIDELKENELGELQSGFSKVSDKEKTLRPIEVNVLCSRPEERI